MTVQLTAWRRKDDAGHLYVNGIVKAVDSDGLIDATWRSNDLHGEIGVSLKDADDYPMLRIKTLAASTSAEVASVHCHPSSSSTIIYFHRGAVATLDDARTILREFLLIE